MNTEPPTKVERLLFTAQVLALAAIGTGFAAIVFALVIAARGAAPESAVWSPSVVDHLAFIAQVFLGAGVVVMVVRDVVKGREKR